MLRCALRLPSTRYRDCRSLHTIKATLIDPLSFPGNEQSKVDITVGEPGEAFIMVKPQIGSILARKELKIGKTIEVPLVFYHHTKHFARGS